MFSQRLPGWQQCRTDPWMHHLTGAGFDFSFKLGRRPRLKTRRAAAAPDRSG
jgi:hypothetical protein